MYGFSPVLLVWTNGVLRVPLGIRLWCKGGPSKYALALELLSAMPAIACAAAPSMCCSTPGIPPKLS